MSHLVASGRIGSSATGTDAVVGAQRGAVESVRRWSRSGIGTSLFKVHFDTEGILTDTVCVVNRNVRNFSGVRIGYAVQGRLGVAAPRQYDLRNRSTTQPGESDANEA